MPKRDGRSQQIPLGLAPTENAGAERGGTPREGLLATNHLNLMHMLATSLIMPPAGFGAKYYRDSLERFPGWIPLFLGQPFRTEVEASTREASHLMPCLARVRLADLAGPVLALRGGNVRKTGFPGGLTAKDEALLVPAPLPASWLTGILFRSARDKKECVSQARDYNNVLLEGIELKAAGKALAGLREKTLPAGPAIPSREAPLAIPLAAGAILAMLLHGGNRGEASVRACRAAFDPDAEDCPVLQDPILAALPSWLRQGKADVSPNPPLEPAAAVDLPRWLFWGAVDELAGAQAAGASEGARDRVLAYLTEKSALLEPRRHQKLEELRNALESLAGFGDLDVGELFKRHAKPFSRALALFHLRESCEELLAFEHPLLTETDRLAASILFGAGFGWLEVPNSLRDFPGLPPAVSHRMAAVSHRMADTGLELGLPPPRCRPLRELLYGDTGWTGRGRDAAALLARKNGWDCVQTVIRLGPGDCKVRVKREGLEIAVPGQPKGISTEVDADRFFELLASARLASATERELRGTLGD